MLKRLYHWILNWSESPYGAWALFFLAFSESSFFPIPPDVLLIALAVGKPEKSFKFAAICALGSILGGILGYVIGWQFMAAVGEKIVAFYGLSTRVEYIEVLYNRYDAWAVGIAGFTPIPYKVFTIAAGVFKINFFIFIAASAISRSARFFLVAGLIYYFGPGIQTFIEKYFNLLVVVFIILLVGFFVILKYIF